MSQVYFIRALMPEGPIKIGSSRNPITRKSSLLLWSPVPLALEAACPGDVILERRFHGLLRGHHSHSEWFRTHPEVEAVVKQVAAGTFDYSCLPEPFDVRNKANSIGDGLGPLAASLSMRLRTVKRLGIAVPDDVAAASRRFSNNPHQVGWANTRDVADAAFVSAWLDQHVKPSEQAVARLSAAIRAAGE